MIRTVFVTGASSGFGLATVIRVAELGFAAVGLVPDQLAEKTLREEARRRSVSIDVVVADLRDPDGRGRLVADAEPWALVNNAGYMNAGLLRDIPIGEAREQLEAMVLAPMDLAVQALPGMLKRGEGRIVNVTSAAVHTSTPLTGWYQACKAALRELTDSLRLELRHTGVDIIDLEPGGYQTGIWARAGSELRERRRHSGEPQLYDRVLERLERGQSAMSDPEEVAGVVGDLLTVGDPPSHRRVGPGSGLLRSLDSLVPDRVWDLAVSTVARAG